jgi:hypothetical protein
MGTVEVAAEGARLGLGDAETGDDQHDRDATPSHVDARPD